MKRSGLKVLVIASAVIALSAPAATASMVAPIKATIPFAFAAAGTNVPAGEYTIEQHTAPGVLLIRDANHRAIALVRVSPAYAKIRSEQARLVFNKYGNSHFLAQVWSSGRSAGFQLSKTRREREAMAAGPSRQIVLAIATR